jgi:DNA-binding CsgD family transcriptional regulator
MPRDLLGIVEANYCESDVSWEQRIVDAASPLDQGHGLFVGVVRIGHDRFSVERSAATQGNGEYFERVWAHTPIEILRHAYQFKHCGKAGSQLINAKNAAVFQELMPPGSDCIGIVGQVHEDRWVGVYVPTPRIVTVDVRTQHRHRLLGIHLAAGRRLADASSTEAVLDAGGAVVHAEGPARSRVARNDLKRMALTIDRVRTRKGRSDPDNALSVWKGLVSGRWSLVETFERDGKRLTIARKNSPNLGRALKLSGVEQMVVKLLANGQSQKYIAYTLGISSPAVSQHVMSAMLKLGVRDKSSLVSLVTGLTR